jgi:hypothetical protein
VYASSDLTVGLASAFDRLDDFLAVQSGVPFPQQVEAVELLQAAVGIDAAARSAILRRVTALGHADRAAAVLLGVIVGVFATQDGPAGAGSPTLAGT